MLKSLFSDLALKAAKSENNKGFSTPEKACISSQINNFIDKAAGGIVLILLWIYMYAVSKFSYFHF